MTQPTSDTYSLQNFNANGFCIIRSWLDAAALLEVRTAAIAELDNAAAPWELEAEAGYPCAPLTVDAEGGQTPRRLLQAYARSPIFKLFATEPKLKSVMQRLLPADEVMLTQAHHNCIMTKLPQYSSHTGWHQDYRYWSFDSSNLITAWLALGCENAKNGGLQVVPGSHKLELAASQFDKQQFFKAELPENQKILSDAINVQLNPGDLLCFHANTLHSATRNSTLDPKVALVFTFHNALNYPTPNTRSSLHPSIALP